MRPLVGRGAELDDLDDLLSSVSGGGGATVLIEGEAGVGRTRLVEALQGSASLLGVGVCAGRGAGPGAAPYALLADVLLAPAAHREARGPVSGLWCEAGSAGGDRRRP